MEGSVSDQTLVVDLRSPFLKDVIMKCRKGEKSPLSEHFVKYRNGHIGAILAPIEIESRFPSNFEDILINLDLVKQEVRRMDSGFAIVVKPEEIKKANEKSKIALVLGLEGGAPLRGSESLLRTVYELGLRWIELTWNVRNEIGDGVGEPNACGLSEAGMKIVREMNNLGMIVDLAHISINTFKSVMEITEDPVIVSHSNCKEICNNPRNLTDQQIEQVAENGGLIGLCFYPPFLSESGNATMTDLLRHMNHIRSLVGVDHVGIGPDFLDCLGYNVAFPEGLENATKIPNLITTMTKEGYSEEDIWKIMRGNFLRVFEKVAMGH